MEVAAVVLALGILMLVGFGFLITRALLRTATFTPQAMVTVALAMLTMVALAGFVVTRQEVLGSIAATGVGALAGSVTALFTASQDHPPPRHRKPPEPFWTKKRPPPPRKGTTDFTENGSESV